MRTPGKGLALSLVLAVAVSRGWCEVACESCHPEEAKAYARTGMARSLSAPNEQPPGHFTHMASGTKFGIRSVGASMFQRIDRNGVSAEYPILYAVGSGDHAVAYVVRVGDYLFQSPISWYSKRGIWGMAPGFEQDRLPDFTRPVTAECLDCHTGRTLSVELTLNRYEPPYIGEMGIGCNRCHGRGDSHVRHPSRWNIVNPARLAGGARDSVCEQCHLAGEARVANPGREAKEFQPDEALEEIFSTYVFASASGQGNASLKVISHSEQLRKSLCARRSGGQLWCGTCHNPHKTVSNKRLYFRERCLSCHGQQLAQTHPAPAEDCVGCHMPTRPARDGGHTAFTDHRIVRLPEPDVEPRRDSLVAWREPPASFVTRNLGLAYIATGERDQLPGFVRHGRELLLSTLKQLGNDHAVLTSLGVASLRMGLTQDAVDFFQRALKLRPLAAAYHVNLATALAQTGRTSAAIEHLNRAIDLDPSLEVAYRRLAEIFAKEHREDAIREVFERYVRFRPQSLAAMDAIRSAQVH